MADLAVEVVGVDDDGAVVVVAVVINEELNRMWRRHRWMTGTEPEEEECDDANHIG